MTRTIQRFGWHPSPPDHRDYQYHLEERVLRAAQLPKTVDLWPNVPPIWNQGQLGSCSAHGSLRAFLTEAIRQGVPVPMLSRLMQYFDTRAIEGTTGSDNGGTCRDAIKALVKTGCAPEAEWPYDIAKFTEKPPAQAYTDAKQYLAVKYQSVAADATVIRSALASGLAVVIGFSVPESFEDGSWNPATAPLPLPASGEGFVGGHCVALTGYDFSGDAFPPYWVADNSWDTSWGGSWGADVPGGRFALDARWLDAKAGLACDFWVIQAVK